MNAEEVRDRQATGNVANFRYKSDMCWSVEFGAVPSKMFQSLPYGERPAYSLLWVVRCRKALIWYGQLWSTGVRSHKLPLCSNGADLSNSDKCPTLSPTYALK